MAKDDDIHIAITSERKQRWRDHIENDPNIDSLTELVRDAVENHIERQNAPGNDASHVEIDLEPIVQPLDELQGGMREAIEGIQEINERVSDTSEAAQLADTVYPLLPEASGPSDLDDARRELDDDTPERTRAMTTGDARDFAAYLNKDIGTVMHALTIAETENDEVRIYDTGETLEAYIYSPDTNDDGGDVGGE